jgi:benzil reductase ((S)-benzoin forming)
MNYYYISGTSRGIGKALAEELLKNDTNYIIGFSRTNSIKHERFEFIPIDLSKPEKAMEFRFIQILDAESITLVNNSGTIGHIEHVGKISNQSILDSFNVNIVSPAILINNFVRSYQQFASKKTVICLSSGAARYAIESWSSYCAGKAALDMYSSVAQLDQDRIKPLFPVRFFAVAPGVVDTKMQEEIRQVSADSFGDVKKFINYMDNKKLLSPEEVATKLIKLMDQSDAISSTILELRELNI